MKKQKKNKIDMLLLCSYHGYNFYKGFNNVNEPFYNVVPENQPAPDGGYYSSDFICKMKNVPNYFKINP